MRLIRRGLVLALNLSSPAEREEKGCQAPGLASRPGCTRAARLVAMPPLTQHCIVQAHIDHGFEVQHAEVALWVRDVELKPPHLFPLPDSLLWTPHYLQPLCGTHTPEVPSVPADEKKTPAGLEAWKHSGSGGWAPLEAKQRPIFVFFCPASLGSLCPSHQAPSPAQLTWSALTQP